MAEAAVAEACELLAREAPDLGGAVAAARHVDLEAVGADALSRFLGLLCDAASGAVFGGADALALAVRCCGVDGVHARRCDPRARVDLAAAVARELSVRGRDASMRDAFRCATSLLGGGGRAADRIVGAAPDLARRAARCR